MIFIIVRQRFRNIGHLKSAYFQADITNILIEKVADNGYLRPLVFN